jgi:predicted CopG family antitoxin
MGTKTISLDLEAYERLRALKKPSESFSDVVKRLAEGQKTIGAFRRAWSRLDAARLPSQKELDEMEKHLNERSPYVPSRYVVSD